MKCLIHTNHADDPFPVKLILAFTTWISFRRFLYSGAGRVLHDVATFIDSTREVDCMLLDFQKGIDTVTLLGIAHDVLG